MNAVRSARLPRSIAERLSTQNATDIAFSSAQFFIRKWIERIDACAEGVLMSADATPVLLRTDTVDEPDARRAAPQQQPKRPSREQPRRAPREQPQRPIETLSEPEKAPESQRRPWLRWVLFALLPLALIAGTYWYVTGGQIMSTDNAYVGADKVGVSTDVSGIVKEIDVTENQHVEAGQILYALDRRQYPIPLDNAKANLAQVALSVDAMKQDYRRMLSDVAAQQEQVKLDQETYDRYTTLVRTDAISRDRKRG